LVAIDKLDDGQHETLQRMEPKLAAVYKRNGTWIDIIRNEMGFPESLPMKIREVWENNLAGARLSGIAIDKIEFAMMFVDQDFQDYS
jgi:hypothetical protein